MTHKSSGIGKLGKTTGFSATVGKGKGFGKTLKGMTGKIKG